MPRLTRPALSAALAACAVVLAGCPDDPTQSDDLGWLDKVGADKVLIDASSEDNWIYFSFKEMKVVATPEKPEDSLAWDFAVRRYNFRTNGGTSGKGQGAVADLGEADQETTNVAKVGTWIEDGPIEDARTGEEIGMSALLSGWYSYHFIKHELVSQYHLYAVRGADGQVATLKIYSYYDTAGNAGQYQLVLRYPIPTSDAPANTDGGTPQTPTCIAGGTGTLATDTVTETNGVTHGELNVDARAAKLFLSFADHAPVAIDGDPKASNAWDLGVDDWLFTTNSGTSGGGQGGALKAGTTDFAAATTAPETGWVVDTVEQIALERSESTNLQLAGWFNYETGTQCIRSFGEVYWIRTASGKFAKLQLVDYYHPVDGSKKFYRLRWAYRADGGRAF